MSKAKDFFRDNVDRLPTAAGQPIAYNEQRGFLALAEALERVESRLLQIEEAQNDLRREIQSLSGRGG